MVASNFECLVGYRTLRDEGQKAYDCVLAELFQAPSLHTESTDSEIRLGPEARVAVLARFRLSMVTCTALAKHRNFLQLANCKALYKGSFAVRAKCSQ